jgi:Ca-activated chloride channel family protein
VTVRLSGTVNGREQTFTYSDNVLRDQGGDEFIPRLWATRAIGHLLTEIRLHGENPELVQSIVNLSIRYGIITPYTSYLIEEDDIFSQTGRQIIVEEAMTDVAGEAVAATRVTDMVEEAAASADMAAAEAPLALPTAMASAPDAFSGAAGQPVAVDELVQLVGSKTFVFRDGRWIDTAFDADEQTPQQVGFATDAYFDLLSAAPELGQYLALGQHVLLVYEGTAYEIVAGEGQAEITLPPATTAEDTPVANTGDGAPADTLVIPAAEDTAPPAAGPRATLCHAALALPLLLIVGLVVGRYGRRK